MVGQRIRRGELAPAVPVHADKIRIAEAADGARPILLAPAPQIAAGEAQKDRRPARLSALALDRQKHFLGRIGH